MAKQLTNSFKLADADVDADADADSDAGNPANIICAENRDAHSDIH